MMNKEMQTNISLLYGETYPAVGKFNVFKRENFEGACNLPPNRRDYFKIQFILNGDGIATIGNTSVKVSGNTVIYMNPSISCSYDSIGENQTGYFCLFTEDFISSPNKNESLSQSPLFKEGGNHIFPLDSESVKLHQVIFERILQENQSEYSEKKLLIEKYLHILMLEAMKTQPHDMAEKSTVASERTVNAFLGMLERQFPIDSPNHIIRLKDASEFAGKLNIHTNHLNRVLKKTTGKTTTEWINGRIKKEAQALLKFSNWDISEIAYCLGFEHPSNFYSYFKKQTGITALQFRKENVSLSS